MLNTHFTKVVISKSPQEAFTNLLKGEDLLRNKNILLGDCELLFKRYAFENERIAMQFIESNNHGRYNIASIIDLGELNLPKGIHKYIFYGKIE
ncbi:MAG: hypothetical protein AB9856_12365 [Cellulosilyticaceae bacterium]